MKYQQKAVIVDAEQWEPPEHLHDDYDYELTMNVIWKGKEKKYFTITSDGIREITPGDWIVTDAKGGRYVVKPDVFVITYEEIKEAEEVKTPNRQEIDRRS